jgi:DNA-directed RNA polymerase specialized sigma24 family protein
MVPEEPEVEDLLRRAGEGDPAARDDLLSRHRRRLRQMVGVRMDRRLVARRDPSDVVQEALTDAARELPAFLRAGGFERVYRTTPPQRRRAAAVGQRTFSFSEINS